MNLKGLAQKKEIIFVFGRKLSLCASLWRKGESAILCVYIVPNLLILDQFVLNITGR